MNNLLPDKSVYRYNDAYSDFRKWLSEKFVHLLKKDVFLVYFDELAQTIAPFSLWSRYSMLKSTVQLKHNVDIVKYGRLKSCLKKYSNDFKARIRLFFNSRTYRNFLNRLHMKSFFYKVILYRKKRTKIIK